MNWIISTIYHKHVFGDTLREKSKKHIFCQSFYFTKKYKLKYFRSFYNIYFILIKKQDWKDFSLRPRGFELSDHFYSLLENHSLRLSFISKIQILQNLHLNLFCTSSVPFNNRINWETQSKYFISTEESKITEGDKSAEGSELLLYPCQ